MERLYICWSVRWLIGWLQCWADYVIPPFSREETDDTDYIDDTDEADDTEDFLRPF